VEPGLYFNPQNAQFDERWQHIGIRIEDDVLVTASGCEVLSQALPKSPDEIERLMQT